MKIKSVQAYWVHIPIPHDRQHVSDYGRTLSFDGTIVRIETKCGLTGWGEAKAQVGGMAQNQALTLMINEEFAPLLVGVDPRDISIGKRSTMARERITRCVRAACFRCSAVAASPCRRSAASIARCGI